MRRTALAFVLFLAGIFCLAQQEHVSANWQSRDSNYNTAISGGAAPAYTATDGACQTFSFVNTVTFTSRTIGVGTVVVGITDDNGGSPYTGVTINGNTATKSSASDTDALWYASNASGSTGNIVITSSTPLDVVCIGVGVLTNLSSSTPTCAGSCPTKNLLNESAPYSLGSSLTVPASGFGILVFAAPGGNTSYTWSNATGDSVTYVQSTAGNGRSLGMAHMTTTATPSVTACNVACAWDAWATGAWH